MKHLMLQPDPYLENLRIRVLVAGFTHVHANWKYRAHRPSYNRLYYVKSGYGFVEINGVRYLPEKEEMLLVPAGAKVSFGTLPGKETFTKYWIHFDARLGETPLFDILSVPYLTSVHAPEFITGCFQKILASEQKKEDLSSILYQQSAVLDLIAWIIEQQPTSSRQQTATGRFDTILAYIQNHFLEKITVEDLSQMAGLHPNHFIKVFRGQIGTSPGQYINKLRIDKARELLVEETYTIGEIASMTGFHDESYFSKTFKKYIGRTPREYRREMLSSLSIAP